jgi:ATP-dependent helicase/nuclease subunit B
MMAMLGEELTRRHRETRMVELARSLDVGRQIAPHPRPQPIPRPISGGWTFP